MFKPVDVLAVGAHPDDVDFGCGGTLARLRSLGRRVGILDLTRGELGSRGTPERRLREAEEAARILRAEFRENLGLEDGNIRADAEERFRLVEVVRFCRPRLVITHSCYGHPDHGRTARLVEEAVHHAGLARIETGQERFRPEKIARWLHFRQTDPPHVVVDISGHLEVKMRLIQAFASQLFDPGSTEPETYLSRAEFLDQIRAFHRHLGNQIEADYGEGFLLSRPPRIADLVEC